METRFCEGQRSKGNNSKSINARINVLALCTVDILVIIILRIFKKKKVKLYM